MRVLSDKEWIAVAGGCQIRLSDQRGRRRWLPLLGEGEVRDALLEEILRREQAFYRAPNCPPRA